MPTNFTINPAVEAILVELEVQRKHISSTNIKGWGAILVGVISIFVAASFGGLIIGLITGGAIIIYGIVVLNKIAKEAAIYKRRFKNDVIGAALRNIDPSLTINPNDGISETEFRFSQLFPTTPDRYFTEDLITGKIDKTSFYFAEVHAEYKTETQTKNGKQTHWHDILKGIIFVGDFNKHFNGITIIRPKDFGASLGAWFAKNVYSFGDKNVVELENDEFNKNFVVYSNDQIEARYILTPALMERIGALNQRCSNTISLSFINANMYIAFPLAKNYFEPPIYKTLLKPNLLDEDLSVLSFMHDIVHELDLNTRIWTKA